MSEPITHEVTVHKANLPLAKDESVTDFTQALGDAARAHVMTAYRMDPKVDYAYTLEVYTGTIILSCCIYSKSEDRRGKYIYTSVTYERDTDSGAFTFGTPTEVQRVTTYKPKPLIKTVKGMGAAGFADIEVFGEHDGAPGYQPVTKALWSGVL